MTDVAYITTAEAALLRTARVVLGGEPSPQVARVLLRQRTPSPHGLTPICAAALRRILARGAVRALTHGGGWRVSLTLAAPAPRTGRLWERHAPPPLVFSPATVALLGALSEADPLLWRSASPADPRPVGVADDLLWALAVDRLRLSDLPPAWPTFVRSPLAWLLAPDALAPWHAPVAIDLSAFVQGAGAVVLEGLQGTLARRWTAMEQAQAAVTDPEIAGRLGRARQAALDALIEAAATAGRLDLASFVLVAADRALTAAPEAWLADLDRHAGLGARAEARHAAGALARAAMRLDDGRRALGMIPFFEPEYAAARALLTHWAPHAGGLPRAAALTRHLDALRSAAAPEAS